VLLGIGDDLAIGWMIGGFDGDDPLADRRMLLVQVLGKLRLRARWTDDQDLAGIVERGRDLLQEMLVGRGMAAADGVRLVVQMLGLQMRMQRQLVGTGETDMEQLGLAVIEPHDGMKMSRHDLVLVSKSPREQAARALRERAPRHAAPLC
jgi:hypothetical protein